jgi:hypothetical protein
MSCNLDPGSSKSYSKVGLIFLSNLDMFEGLIFEIDCSFSVIFLIPYPSYFQSDLTLLNLYIPYPSYFQSDLTLS